MKIRLVVEIDVDTYARHLVDQGAAETIEAARAVHAVGDAMTVSRNLTHIEWGGFRLPVLGATTEVTP